MRGYGQFCPLAKASEVLGERWTFLVIRELSVGSESFTDLRRGVPLMSPSLLSNRLKSLEDAGIIDRRVNDKSVRYQLTRAGRELTPILLQLGTWAQRWARSDLSENDLDPALLVWDMHRNLDTDYFTAERTVIKIEFTDIYTAKRYWWLVIRHALVDVCLKDPGFPVDLTLACQLRELTAVWLGDTSISKAVRSKQIRLEGSPGLRRNIAGWLKCSYFANVKAESRRTHGNPDAR